MRLTAVALSLAALSFAVTGCVNSDGDHHDHADMAHMHENMWASVNHAVAVMEPTQGNTISGVIDFTQMPDGLHIHGTISGLAPGSSHAIHIHEFGDQNSADGMSAGGHYDPEGTHHHGAPGSAEPHHAGDFGNIQADASGVATVDLTVTGISIAGMKDPILGRSVVIHAKTDDFVTQPTGNAGGRIGVGVIGVAKPIAPAK